MAGRGSPLPAIILTLAASSLVMAFFCWLSPREADDIIYAAGLSMPSLAATGQSASAAVPPSSLGELLRLQWQEYLQWNGRFVGQFLARCLLLAPDWLHAVLTPLVHASLLFSSLILLWGKRWREKLTPWHIVLLAGLLWFMLPAFGSAFFWRTGTANYGYTLCWPSFFSCPTVSGWTGVCPAFPEERPSCWPVCRPAGAMKAWGCFWFCWPWGPA